MLNTQTIKSLTDLRSNPLNVIKLAQQEGAVYILNRTRPTSVLLSLEKYDEMVDLIDDYLDGIWMAEQEKKPFDPKDWIPWEEVKKSLKIK